MSFKLFSWYSVFLVILFLFSFLTVSAFFLSLCSFSVFSGFSLSENFFLDYVGFCFSLLSIILGVSVIFFSSCRSGLLLLFLSASVFFSILCYLSCNMLLFWIFYEFSILCLLVLLVIESPYSERFIASWYLLGYVVFTSLPMFLCILYLSSENGSFLIYMWRAHEHSFSFFICLFLLSFLFITKIPLTPFHIWLPIVHAEAPSPVSVFLSGYIMKLGVLGLYRFCSSIQVDFIFCPFYVFVVLLASLIFFLCSCRELDGKRWLAFLSLSHISVVCFCVCYCDYTSFVLPFYFCLGHGLSAGSTFILLWLLYDLSSSRNWLVLKSLVSGGNINRVLIILCLFSTASIPPTITFFSEVLMFGNSLFYGLLVSLVFCCYLFFSGLVPLFLLGFVLGRSVSVSLGSSNVWVYYNSLFLLVFWIYFMFLLF